MIPLVSISPSDNVARSVCYYSYFTYEEKDCKNVNTILPRVTPCKCTCRPITRPTRLTASRHLPGNTHQQVPFADSQSLAQESSPLRTFNLKSSWSEKQQRGHPGHSSCPRPPPLIDNQTQWDPFSQLAMSEKKFLLCKQSLLMPQLITVFHFHQSFPWCHISRYKSISPHSTCYQIWCWAFP